MTAARTAAVALIVIATVSALHYFCVRPLRCHVLEPRLESMSIDGRVDPARSRSTIASALACARVQPNHVNFYLIAAINCADLRQYDRAVSLYEKAIERDRRPEIYAGLGNTLAKLGRHEEAVQNLLRANMFFPNRMNDIEDPFVHDEVERRYNEYRASIENRR